MLNPKNIVYDTNKNDLFKYELYYDFIKEVLNNINENYINFYTTHENFYLSKNQKFYLI